MPDWLPYVLAPAIASLVGGAIAVILPVREQVRAAVQLFTGGVIMAAVAMELLPQLTGERPGVVAVGFVVGTIIMLGVKLIAERAGSRGIASGETATGLVLALAVDTFIDGMLLGVAFVRGGEEGFVLALALALEALFLNLSATTAAEAAGSAPRWVVAIAGGLALLVAVSAAAGVAIFSALRS